MKFFLMSTCFIAMLVGIDLSELKPENPVVINALNGDLQATFEASYTDVGGIEELEPRRACGAGDKIFFRKLVPTGDYKFTITSGPYVISCADGVPYKNIGGAFNTKSVTLRVTKSGILRVGAK